ncbi:MAG TPA: polysaccharide pyruvyl transferase CsaB [Trueperaceae bacterium]|nr:polysaccharide pyruvyl transferase CsaB [Trueperaceae bacterium]
MHALLSGYYGYGNLGDEALLAGLVGGLKARGIEPVVLSGDPAATSAQLGVVAVHRYRGLLPALSRCDALVSGGGGLLQDGTSRRSLSYYLTVIRLARALGKRVVVYGQSVGPLSEAGQRRVGRALEGLPLAVRDAPSVNLLGALGLAAERVADPALLLPAPAPSGTEGPVILVPRAGHDDLNEALAAAGRLLQQAGLDVAVLALHEREDAAATERIAATAPASRLVAVTPEQALQHFADARYVLSARLHGLILAARTGVGFAGLVYDPKVAGFLGDAGAPAFTRPVEPRRLADLATVAQRPDPDLVAALVRRAEAGMDWLALHIRG